MLACPSCGRQNPDEARFCQNCASPLERGGDSARARKTVTVLFTDVVGSTELAATLDPEARRVVMARFFDAVRSPIERHGGTVEKYIGDAVMAVFGVPTVHEDDPLRACKAAVEIRDNLDALNKELERDLGVTIALRTGIDSGEVVAGEAASGQRLVTGDPVVAAARLEQAADAGAILVGAPTVGLVGDAVDAEPVAPVSAKGMRDPLEAYQLVSVSAAAGVRTVSLASPLVGRERELRILTDEFERCLETGDSTMITVIGDPGIGKSRLVREAVATLADEAVILKGRCLPYGDGITFWPILEVVRQAAGISDAMSAEEAVARIEELLPATDRRDAMRDRVAAAVGLRDAVGDIHETFWAIRQLLEEQARHHPLVVVFEDIHWAEPAFLDLVEYLGERTRGAMFLVCLARPELLQERADWSKGSSRASTIELEPLGTEENDRLVRNLLGGGEVSPSIAAQVAETAEGNPLFVEEIVGMLIDEKRVVRRHGTWTTSTDVSSMPTPRTVQSVLSARIERLPVAQRAVLQRAAVVGRVFWWGAIAHLSPADEQAHVGAHLRAMVHTGLIEPDEGSFAGEDAFKFRHILIRDAAYASLPKASRSTLHRGFADWMERATGERTYEYEEILGYHLEQACVLKQTAEGSLDRELAARASRLLTSAAQRAIDRDDIRAARNLASRASELSVDDAETNRIDLILADALKLSAPPQRADEILAVVEARARNIGDRGTEWLAKVKRAELLSVMTNVPMEDLQLILDRALDVFTELEHDEGLSETWSLIAWLRFNAGRAREATEASELTARHAVAAGDLPKSAWASISMTNHASFGETPVQEALDLCRSVLEQVKGQLGFEAVVGVTLGRLEAMQGNFVIARDAIERARSILEDLGVSHGLAGMTEAAADVANYEGDFVREERELRDGYERFRRTEARAYQATWAALLAMNLLGRGRDEEAFELASESESLAPPDDVTAQVPWREARALVLAHRGEAEESERLAREAVSIADATDFLTMRGEAHQSLANVLASLERPDEAAEEFRAAEDLFDRKGNLVARDRAREARERVGRRAHN